MAKYQAEVKYIGSIYPGAVTPQRRNYGPSRESKGPNAVRSTLFEMKPVPRGQKAYVLPILDSFEDVLDPVSMSSMANPGKGEKPRMAKPVPVEEIVSDLLGCWTGHLFNVPSGAKPGIIEVVNSVPSQAELRQMDTQQSLYFEYLFAEGERLHNQNDWKEITETMRLAAEWLGHKRTWSHQAIARDAAPCPFCTKIIPNSALVCEYCSKTVKALPPELLRLQNQSYVPPAA